MFLMISYLIIWAAADTSEYFTQWIYLAKSYVFNQIAYI